MEEAKQFSVEDNPLLVIDKENIRKSNDFGDYREYALAITLVCHAGIVDLSAFKDDIFGFRKKNGHIMPYLKSIQGGMTSIYPYFTNVPTAGEYWKFYPVNILFRDTMCFAPAEGKSLAILGDCVDVPKIVLPEGVIRKMQPYLENHKNDFLAYAAQDALVTIMYGSRLWGINKEWCLTATSGSAFAMKQSMEITGTIADEVEKILQNFSQNYGENADLTIIPEMIGKITETKLYDSNSFPISRTIGTD